MPSAIDPSSEHAASATVTVKSVLGQLARFGGIGVVLAGVHYALFVGLLLQGIAYPLALIASWVPCVGLSYVLNRAATFRVEGSANAAEAIRFFTTAALQLGLSLVGMVVLVESLCVPVVLASFINVGVAALLSFTMLKLYVFARSRPSTP